MPPSLDVSDILSDPDFADTFTVIRRSQTVGDDGMADGAERAIRAVGVVQPASANGLKLLPEGARVDGAIQIHTAFHLSVATDTTFADEVVYNGRRYMVTATNDFSRFGAGYIQAVCELKNLLDVLP